MKLLNAANMETIQVKCLQIELKNFTVKLLALTLCKTFMPNLIPR